MWTSIDSPLGPLLLVSDGDALTAVEYSGHQVPSPSPRSSASVAAARARDRAPGERRDDDPLLREVARQLRAYFARELKEFDLPLRPAGTPFQLRVWEQLRGIGYGETVSYGEIARRLRMTAAASRAVGLANGRNPIPIVVPCHRVVGANGTLTGYAGGIDRKQTLLALEQEALF